jgi:TldD protein
MSFLDEDLVNYFLGLVAGSDFGDIRLACSQSFNVEVNNGEVRSVGGDTVTGFNLRVCSKGIWGHASSTNVSREAIADCVAMAYKMIRASNQQRPQPDFNVDAVSDKCAPPWKIDPRTVDASDKLGVCLEADKASRLNGVHATQCFYEDTVTEWLVGNSIGTRVSYYTCSPRLIVAVYVKDESTTHMIYESLASNGGFELFGGDAVSRVGATAATKALGLVGARPVRGGVYDVVLDPAMTGVYIHEAFGHASEADIVMAGTSILEGKVGSKVGAEIVGVVDDPTIQGLRGSYLYDQEGVRAQKRSIVEGGVLKTYLHTLESASRLGGKPNGAARAMGPLNAPIARMSNIYVGPGDFGDDIYSDIKLGVAFYGFHYGYVDPGSGKFMFKAQYGRMIRDGELAEYVRDAALTGYTLDVLNRVDALGKTVEFVDGTCGKDGQWVPVTTGGPYTRVRGVVVGGQ